MRQILTPVIALIVFMVFAMVSVDWTMTRKAESSAQTVLEDCLKRGSNAEWSSESSRFGYHIKVQCNAR